MTNLRATFELHEASAGVLRRPRRINPPSATPPQPVERRARAPADLRALARPHMPHSAVQHAASPDRRENSPIDFP